MASKFPIFWLVIKLNYQQSRHRLAESIRRQPLLPALAILTLGLIALWWQWSSQSLSQQLAPLLGGSGSNGINRFGHLLSLLGACIAWGLYLLTQNENTWLSIRYLPLKRRDWLLGISVPLIGMCYASAVVLMGPIWAALYMAIHPHLLPAAWWGIGAMSIALGVQAGLALAAGMDRLLDRYSSSAIRRYFLRQFIYVGSLGIGIGYMLRTIISPQLQQWQGASVLLGRPGEVVGALIQRRPGAVAWQVAVMIGLIIGWTSLLYVLQAKAAAKKDQSMRSVPTFSHPQITKYPLPALIGLFQKQLQRDAAVQMMVGLFATLPLGTASLIHYWHQPLLTALYPQLSLMLIPLAIIFLPVRLRRYLSQVPSAAHARPLKPWQIVMAAHMVILVSAVVVLIVIWVVSTIIAGAPFSLREAALQLAIALATTSISAVLSWCFSGTSKSQFDITLPHAVTLIGVFMVVLGLFQTNISHPGRIISLATTCILGAFLVNWRIESRAGRYS